MSDRDDPDRAAAGGRAWARLLDLLAREVARRLGPKTDPPDGPPASGAEDGPRGGGDRGPQSR